MPQRTVVPLQRSYSRTTRWLLVAAILCLTLSAALLGSEPPTHIPPSRSSLQQWSKAPQTIVAYSLERQVEMEQRVPVLCDPIPQLSQVHHVRTHWQSPYKSGLHLYSAYYDVRLRHYHYVRVLGMMEGHRRNESLYCQLWYTDSVVVLEALRVDIWASQWDANTGKDSDDPVLISCPVPKNISASGIYPTGVSITLRPCENAHTFLSVRAPPVAGTREKRKAVAVCVKGLDFANDSISIRLAEWIEMNLILGADRLLVYVYSVSEKTKRVLLYYVKRGVLELIPLSLPSRQPDSPPARRSQYLASNLWQKRRNEVVPYNDCYYRCLYTHQFVLPIDVDEVIVPVKERTWPSMLRRLLVTEPDLLDRFSSLSVRNAYFFDQFSVDESDGIPSYHHILRHTIRSANFSPRLESVKSFVSTDGALTVFNHYALQPLRPTSARNLVLSTEIAQMNHYRASCSVPDCGSNFLRYKIRDVLILKYAPELVSRLKNALKSLRFLI